MPGVGGVAVCISAPILFGTDAVERNVALEDRAFVREVQQVGPESLRPHSLVRLNDEDQAVAIAAILLMRKNCFVTRVIGGADGIGANGRRGGSCHRELFVLWNNSDPGEFIVSRSMNPIGYFGIGLRDGEKRERN